MDNQFKDRGTKYKKRKNDNKKSQVLGIDDILMNYFCSYMLSTNSRIKRFGLSNLKSFLENIDSNIFKDKPLIKLKYDFLLMGLGMRINGLQPDLILSDIERHMDISALKQQSFFKELNDAEVDYVEESIMSLLNNLSFDGHVVSLRDLCDRYASANSTERDSIVKELRKEIDSISAEFRKYDIQYHNSATTFRLSEMDEFEGEIDKYLKDPSYRLITGMQSFNGILGGGFQKTRLYCLFGLAGEGKTITMVNLLYQLWKYNKNVKPSDTTKKPCICLFTMENLVIEYVCSLFHIITRGKNIKQFTSGKEALEEFKLRKFEYSGEDDIELVITYAPGHSQDVQYLYNQVDQLRIEGYEPVAYFVDYLMRILPSKITGDPYVDYGTVANDLKTFAISKEIPVITASQLNREAAKIIDEGRTNNHIDIIKKLGRATIGDSINIDRNIDASIILVPEKSQTNERYMAFKMTKHRYEIYTDTTSFFQPIYPNPYIAFVEDLYDIKPASKETLVTTSDDMRELLGGDNVNKVSMVQPLNSIKDLIPHQNSIVSSLVEDDPKAEYGLNSKDLVENNLKEIVYVVPLEERASRSF